MSTQEMSTKCCVVGGGPAGLMVAFLLARAGVEVVVLEKHGDFLRDFRGDTVHPSTLELMYELGLLDKLLELPHQKAIRPGAAVGNDYFTVADFSYLPTKCKFIAFMPQWDFLNFLSDEARRYPCFSLRMNTEATGIIEEAGRVMGVTAKTETGWLNVRAQLVIAADGRGSIIRQSAGLEVEDVGAPMDVLWMRISRQDSDPVETMGRVASGAMFIMLNRKDYWQCGFIIPKGKLDEYRQEGIEKFRDRVAAIAPFVADRVDQLKSWDDIKLLTVKVDRLKKWYRDGLLCIGDSAHAMSPVGGVGINLAIQDAVATANMLYKPLLQGTCTQEDLSKVQQRRTYPTRMTQRLQVAIQNKVINPTLQSSKPVSAPWIMHSLNVIPLLRAIPATVIGQGFRPEHIQTPDASRASRK